MREYNSSLGVYITGLIEQKQACGYAYEYEAYILEFFDRFCLERNHTEGTITRNLVMDWAIQRPTEGKNYRNQRVSFVRQLALYMQSLGKNPYIPKHFASETVDVPHILSRAELTSFFSVVDTYSPPQSVFRRLVPTYQILFSPFLLLRPPPCRGLLFATLTPRPEEWNHRNPAIQRQQGSACVPF